MAASGAALLLDLNLSILSLKLGDEKLGDLIPYRLDAHALFAYQFHERLELALDLPFTVLQGDRFELLRDALAAPDFPGADGVSRYGLGDVRLLPRVFLLDPAKAPVGLALVGEVRLPTGDANSFLGERRVLVAPRLAVERTFGPVRLLGNVGWRFRKHAQYLNLLVDDELTLGAGAVVDLPDVSRFTGVQAVAEMHLSTPGSSPFNFKPGGHAQDAVGGAGGRARPRGRALGRGAQPGPRHWPEQRLRARGVPRHGGAALRRDLPRLGRRRRARCARQVPHREGGPRRLPGRRWVPGSGQ